MATYEGPPIWLHELSQWQERLPGLVVDAESHGSVWIGADVEIHAVQLVFLSDHDDSQYTVYCDHWHGHYETANEAVDTAINLLIGARWTTEEYRGDEPSATWLNGVEPDGRAFATKVSYYLNPMDSSEWEVFPGEAWKSVGTIRHYFDLSGVPAPSVALGEKSTWTSDKTEPAIRRWGKDFNWMDDRLGTPEAGMRWTMAGYNQYCFQAPVGWRRAEVPDEKPEFTTFMPPGGIPILRARVAFRDHVSAESETEPYGVRPNLTSHEFQSECDHDSRFSLHKWTSTFANGDSEMIGILYLYVPRGQSEDYREFVDLFDKTIESGRYAPGE